MRVAIFQHAGNKCRKTVNKESKVENWRMRRMYVGFETEHTPRVVLRRMFPLRIEWRGEVHKTACVCVCVCVMVRALSASFGHQSCYMRSMPAGGSNWIFNGQSR